MRDHLPTEQEHLSRTRAALEGVLDAWGYQEIDLPVLERRDLYLKKVGEDLVGKLYDFTHQGRALALRPEWTASVLRAYLRSLQSEPLPMRLPVPPAAACGASRRSQSAPAGHSGPP